MDLNVIWNQIRFGAKYLNSATLGIVKPQEVIFVLGCNLWFVSNREFDDWMDESEDFYFQRYKYNKTTREKWNS